MRLKLQRCVLLLGLLALASCHKEILGRPNIIIFFTDDQGYADVGVYGSDGFETPNLDKLAGDGIRFIDFYVPATVCSPSRAALLTGKYPKRVNMHIGVLTPYSKTGLEPNEYLLPEMLKDNGYTTSCIGKWHLGHIEKYMPNNQGFDDFYGVPYSNDMDGYYYAHNDFQSPPLPFYRNRNVIGSSIEQSQLTKMYTIEAIKQIRERKKGSPFFIYLAHNMPHTPLQVSEAFKGSSERGLYGDVIMELDWSMGEIIKVLKEEDIYKDTMIIFTSDNGPEIGSALPLRGKKAQTWEGGQRVPGIISWPRKIPKGMVSSEVVSTLDIFPTLAKVCGQSIEQFEDLDGINILEVLKNPESAKLNKRPFYYYARNGDLEAVRLGDWKLHISKSQGWNTEDKGEFQMALYNLKTDIGEQHNVANQYPSLVDQLKQMMLDFDSNVK